MPFIFSATAPSNTVFTNPQWELWSPISHRIRRSPAWAMRSSISGTWFLPRLPPKTERSRNLFNSALCQKFPVKMEQKMVCFRPAKTSHYLLQWQNGNQGQRGSLLPGKFSLFLTARLRWRCLRNGLFVVFVDLEIFFWIPQKSGPLDSASRYFQKIVEITTAWPRN